MARYVIRKHPDYFRGFESYRPDVGGYYFNSRYRAIWGHIEQAVVFPSEKSANRTMRNIAALGTSVVCLPDASAVELGDVNSQATRERAVQLSLLGGAIDV